MTVCSQLLNEYFWLKCDTLTTISVTKKTKQKIIWDADLEQQTIICMETIDGVNTEQEIRV